MFKTNRHAGLMDGASVAALIGIAAYFVLPTPAVAGPDACTLTGNTLTCTGDQSAGISRIDTGITTINLSNLTGTVAPAAGQSAVDFENVANAGLDAPLLTLSADATLTASTQNVGGLVVKTSGGTGLIGADGSFLSEGGGDGTDGRSGGGILINNLGAIAVQGDDASAIDAEAYGGKGGAGGSGYGLGSGGDGGRGGISGAITVSNNGALSATGINGHGIFAYTSGGAGNIGGSGGILDGRANGGGAASAVTLTNSGTITTQGASGSALFGRSLGGTGADGTTGGYGGAFGGQAGIVTVNQSGSLTTTGDTAYGVFADSIGGFGGNGQSVSGAVVYGGDGGDGGNASAVSVIDSGKVVTSGANALGIYARSLGGAAGSGGTGSGAVSNGGKGGDGGSAGSVTIMVEAGTGVMTGGTNAHAVYAESAGGTGSHGGNAYGFVGDAAGGGAGGNGGAVNIIADGDVTTAGDGAYGVLAVSHGAHGGYGGTGAGVVAFGGYGGGGSKGGAVAVANNGTISTSGKIALGIEALSVGGGGGVGGAAGGLVSFGGGGPDAPPGCSAGGAISGGSPPPPTDRSLCNDGGTVTVTNAGTVTTSGEFSTAITAASIGGGGGDGNEAIGAFSFGGTGGEGGDGNTVTVTNTGTGSILTTGDYARGIFASSIGGGGGYGGGALAIGVSTQVAIGGSGGNGGNGGFADVTNNGTITTQGEGSTAIYAQSVGGGGGNGGDALAAGLSAFTLSIGGSGGGGGDGSDVEVTNTGTLNIENDKSYGIFAQSVGGGGGTGGAGTSFGASPVLNIAVSLGGSGGGGGAGKSVTVLNSGGIFTAGEDDVAVFAQSVGGGGGVGGAASAQGIAVSTGDVPAVSISFAMGGTGGGGGDGGAVNVTNSGVISTLGDASHGVQAQSVGGGGGAGGDASALGTAMAFGGGSLKLTISLGGSGGGGGSGSNVNLTNSGSISTYGMMSHGLFAQSVGGGGGAGGIGGASKPMLQKIGTAVGKYLLKNALSKSQTSGTSKNLQLNFSMGGSGGVAGDGGAVAVSNTGSIVTEGYNSFGIFGQSVGGGGGAGGGGVSQAGGLVTSKAAATSTLKASVALGGNSGASGNGGTVSVTNSGSVLTFGGDATAIFAQSIGGGGGTSDTGADDGGLSNASGQAGNATGGGALQSLNFLTFNVGGNGSASGDGGVVTVNQTGNIATLGVSSFGIEAQSIGGGGGQGGDASNGYLGLLTLGGQAGAAGNGGAVNVTMKGNIVTAGDGSYGIMAQSVGGGGGMSGDVTGNAKTENVLSFTVPFSVDLSNISGKDVPSSVKLTNLSFKLPSFVGLITGTRKGGGGGTGGAVSVTDTGNITTYGVGADGIFAQSIGGGGGLSGTSSLSTFAFMGSNGDSGSGGTVTVNHTGNITATGSDASAIFAQSVGGSITAKAATRFALYGQAFVSQNESSFATGDDITVTVTGGTLQGGTNTGAGIWIDNGLVNTITIGGGATVEALSGVAIKATANSGITANTVDNSGTVLGDVILAGVPVNSFTNESGAILAPNTKVNLAGGTLLNKGTISPGGVGTAATVEIDGTLDETASSTYVADVGYGVGGSDKLAVTGNATVAGTIAPHFTAITNQPVTLVTTTGTLTNAGVTVAGDTPVVSYGLSFSSNALTLTTTANWVPAGADLNENEKGVGAYLQSIWDVGGSSAMAGVMGQLANLPSGAAYADALAHLSPGPYLVTLMGLQSNVTHFTDNMMSCHGTTGALSPIAEKDCIWGELSPGTQHQSASDSSMAYNGHTVRVQFGGQQHLDNDWVIGGSLGYNKWTRNVSGLAMIGGDDLAAGAVAKYLQGPWVNALALTLDHGAFHSTRWISVPSTTAVSGDSDTLYVGIRGRSTYLFNADPFYFKPYADVTIGYYYMGGFVEQGGGGVGLHVDNLNQTMASFAPMLEVGTTQKLNDEYYLRPYIAGGISVSTDGDWSISGGFQDAPSGIADMTVNQSTHDVVSQLIAGIELLSAGNAILRVQYDARFAPHYTETDGVLKLAMKF